MSAKVNVVFHSGGSFQLKRNLAEQRYTLGAFPVSRGKFRWKDRFTIEEIRLKNVADGPLGVGNALPFSRVRSKLLKPERLHYQVPAVGAHVRLLRVRDVNQVSGRK